MVQKYIIDKTDLPKLIRGEELALTQGSKYRAFCIEINEKLTNGDVIQALFPNIEKDNERLIQEYGSQALYDTFKKWCSLPYEVSV